jgi:holo-[acyl-carrier protein] synthase
MILPVNPPAHSKHQSSRPQGLILDKPYRTAASSAMDSTDTGIVRKTHVPSYVNVNELDGQLFELSISHDGDYATAVAIVPSMATNIDMKGKIPSDGGEKESW